MKLRIQNNTVRVRLNDKEVESLCDGNELINETIFPKSKLEILLTTGGDNQVSFIDQKISITIKEGSVKDWARSDEVTIPVNFDLQDEKKLSILVEKDMKL